MVSPQRRNELGNELEIKRMGQTLDSILPEGLKYKHYPRNLPNDDLKPFVDYMIKEKRGNREIDCIAIECKNWNIVPSQGQFESEILQRFEGCPTYVMKIIIGHVNFTENQLKQLRKRGIIYHDIGFQILPEDPNEIKEEYFDRLCWELASSILLRTGKYRKDCISQDTKINIIGNNEISVKHGFENPTHYNLKNRQSVLHRIKGDIISPIIRVGKRPLDIISYLRFNDDISLNILYVPKDYVVYSTNIEFDIWEHQENFQYSNDETIVIKLREFAKIEKYSTYSDTLNKLAEQHEKTAKLLDKQKKIDKKFGYDPEKRGLENFIKIVQWRRITPPIVVI
ncbi:MAG: hypothetical protein ACREAK_09205 [Nitrosarchaeum sp.]